MMALGHKVFGAGLPGLAVASLCNDVASALTATGTNQATAYAMTAADNEFTTVASGTGAILYAGTPGDEQWVYNGGANPLTVYPASAYSINNLAANVGILVPVNTSCGFKLVSSTRYAGMLSR